MKLTKAEDRAKNKLTNKWQCAYTLQESIPTLEGLVRRGVAVMRRDKLSAMFSPRTALHFKLDVSNSVQYFPLVSAQLFPLSRFAESDFYAV